MGLDLSMPKGEKKICHNCHRVVSIYGYEHQDCEECGKTILPHKDEDMTRKYVPKTGLNVLSLFDGLSGGRIALEKAGIEVKNYFASEIDTYAIQISKKNWKDIVHVGKV